MRNLRYKILFTICTSIVVTQALLGSINASKYYTDHTHKFLGFLGHKNPSTVLIRKIDRNDLQHRATHKSGLHLAGYTDGKVIYLNEDFFARNRSEGINLFTCAHEAAHYVLRHSYQVGKSSLEIEKEADVHAARMLCKYGYTWVLKQEVTYLKQLVDAGQGNLTDGKHPTVQQQYLYLRKILEKNCENNPYKESIKDIKDLLCEINSFSREQKVAIVTMFLITFIGLVR